jgi:hypothetical protein
MKTNFTLLGLFAFILAFAGCSHKPPAIPQNAPKDTTYARQNESFDPLSVKEEDTMKLPDSRLKSGSGSGGKSSGKSGSAPSTREAAGFRVQLIASDQESEARALEQQALLDFKETVYLTFDPPNYKVRLGDCQTRANANELREKAIRLGYDNAWVVQCRVIVSSP